MPRHSERHRGGRVGALRAGVLGADDGIVSTASLVIGVIASGAGRDAILVAGLAGLVAGAMSMAAGEFVSVSSQRDAELADVAREKAELVASPASELDELAHIYETRGVDAPLARTVATQLMAHDPLGAHLRDELGLSDEMRARPIQAAIVSAVAFTAGGIVPVITLLVVPAAVRAWAIVIIAIVCLAAAGVVAARTGGSPPVPAALRVAVGGGAAMAATAIIGRLLGAAGI
ncbi:MAG: VIT1/CCC1 transporter family protein [Acidimicrobiia bacterium]